MGLYTNKIETYLYFHEGTDWLESPSSTTRNFELPIKVDMEFINDTSGNRFVISRYNAYPDGWVIGRSGNSFGYIFRSAGDRRNIPVPGRRFTYELRLESGRWHQYMDGVNRNNYTAPTITQTNAPLKVNHSTIEMKIFSFQIGTELFPCNEGSGSTVTGTEGTVLNLMGNTEWRTQPKPVQSVHIGGSGTTSEVNRIYLGTGSGSELIYEKI